MRHLIATVVLIPAMFWGRIFAQTTTDTIPRTPHQQKVWEHRQRVNDLIRREEEGVLAYNKQFAFGIKLATDGYGLSYEIGWMKSLRWTNILQFELNEKKSPKEYKVSVSDNPYTSGTPFIYGKQNYFYQFKLGFGQQYMIGGKGNKNGVAVSGIYAGGLSLGILRPYYVQTEDSTGQVINIKYNQQDSAAFLGNVYGGTGLGTGWGELAFKPGIHGKVALRFDYGRYNELLSAIEVGVNAEYYFNKVPIMVLAPNHAFFLNSYVTIEFGKRK
ncbi:hypothetical protein [Dinghuibacter silviterrae]|uniref:hypothetical protein n=1 Tax=Dinghuibacter silviterrae TaxID=1539049 RepID=UPI0010640679|nr:hypothetical protein [Dinghuibacter silviterrae]